MSDGLNSGSESTPHLSFSDTVEQQVDIRLQRPSEPPEGQNWELLDNCSPFTGSVGPLFMRRDGLEAGEPMRFGFRVQSRHCNLRQTCHGGMIATFLDVVLARGLIAHQGYFSTMPTISMSVDYLAAARLGDWIESRVRVLKATRNLYFVEATCVGPEGAVVRANGIYKRMPPPVVAEA